MTSLAYIRDPHKDRPRLLREWQKLATDFGIDVIDCVAENYHDGSTPMYVVDRLSRHDATCSSIRAELTGYGAMWLNSPAFTDLCRDKYRTYMWLLAEGIHTPTTWLFSDKDIDRHGIYLKPRYLSKGIGIVRLPDRTARRKMVVGEAYLSQTEVTVRLFSGRKHDFRALVQKTAPGTYSITGMYCRVGGSGQDVTNLSSGARAECPHQVLHSLFPDRAEAIAQSMQAVALHIAACLDKHYQYFLLGIDMMVDEQGHLHVIELNSNPSFAGFVILAEHARISLYEEVTLAYDASFRRHWQQQYAALIMTPLQLIQWLAAPPAYTSP